MYMEFEDPDVARAALHAAIEYLILVDGYTAEQAEDLCRTAIKDCEADDG
jgi:hypothetical protein